MKKAVLISIRPQWVAKIMKKEKTIEVRTKAPKCELPIDVYIYCTKGDYIGHLSNRYVGKVCAKFTLRKISEIENEMRTDLDDSKYPSYFTTDMSEHELLENSFLTSWEINEYLRRKKGYAWHISDLVVFDKPKELCEFYGTPKKINGLYGAEMANASLSKAPQSYCFIEEEE